MKKRKKIKFSTSSQLELALPMSTPWRRKLHDANIKAIMHCFEELRVAMGYEEDFFRKYAYGKNPFSGMLKEIYNK